MLKKKQNNLFRVWCKHDGTWEKDTCVLDAGGTLLQKEPASQTGFMILKPETHIVQFFTGMYDKNGKEIFEGDILKSNPYIEHRPAEYALGVVEFNNTEMGSCGCCFEEHFGAGFLVRLVKHSHEKVKYKRYFNVEYMKYAEVVGNIYENPELLEDAK